MGCRPSKQARSKVRSADNCMCSPRKLKKRKHKCPSVSTASGRTTGTKSGSQKTSTCRSDRSPEAEIEPDPDFPPFSTTSAVYRRSASKTSRITLRLSCDGSTLEIEQCDYDVEHPTDEAVGRNWSSAPNLSKFRDARSRMFRNSHMPLKHSVSAWAPGLSQTASDFQKELTSKIEASCAKRNPFTYVANIETHGSQSFDEVWQPREIDDDIVDSLRLSQGQKCALASGLGHDSGQMYMTDSKTDGSGTRSNSFLHSVLIATNPSFCDSTSVLDAMIDDLECACNSGDGNSPAMNDETMTFNGDKSDKTGKLVKYRNINDYVIESQSSQQQTSSSNTSSNADDYESSEQIVVNLITSSSQSEVNSNVNDNVDDRWVKLHKGLEWAGWKWGSKEESIPEKTEFLEDSDSILDLVALGCPLLEYSSDDDDSDSSFYVPSLDDLFLSSREKDTTLVSDSGTDEDVLPMCCVSKNITACSQMQSTTTKTDINSSLKTSPSVATPSSSPESNFRSQSICLELQANITECHDDVLDLGQLTINSNTNGNDSIYTHDPVFIHNEQTMATISNESFIAPKKYVTDEKRLSLPVNLTSSKTETHIEQPGLHNQRSKSHSLSNSCYCNNIQVTKDHTSQNKSNTSLKPNQSQVHHELLLNGESRSSVTSETESVFKISQRSDFSNGWSNGLRIREQFPCN